MEGGGGLGGADVTGSLVRSMASILILRALSSPFTDSDDMIAGRLKWCERRGEVGTSVGKQRHRGCTEPASRIALAASRCHMLAI